MVKIDDALNNFMEMDPSELEAYSPKSIAESIAKKWVLTAISSDDETLAVRTGQLIVERTDGRSTAGQRKDPKGRELLEELGKAFLEAGGDDGEAD